MSKANEPAFPIEQFRHGMIGLTKRELIAVMAMQGLSAKWNPEPRPVENYLRASKFARAAVILADALLTELDEKETT